MSRAAPPADEATWRRGARVRSLLLSRLWAFVGLHVFACWRAPTKGSTLLFLSVNAACENEDGVALLCLSLVSSMRFAGALRGKWKHLRFREFYHDELYPLAVVQQGLLPTRRWHYFVPCATAPARGVLRVLGARLHLFRHCSTNVLCCFHTRPPPLCGTVVAHAGAGARVLGNVRRWSIARPTCASRNSCAAFTAGDGAPSSDAAAAVHDKHPLVVVRRRPGVHRDRHGRACHPRVGVVHVQDADVREDVRAAAGLLAAGDLGRDGQSTNLTVLWRNRPLPGRRHVLPDAALRRLCHRPVRAQHPALGELKRIDLTRYAATTHPALATASRGWTRAQRPGSPPTSRAAR